MSKRRKRRQPRQLFITYILDLPRGIRILVAALFTLVTILAVTPIVDRIYLTHFYNYETRLLPALVSVSLGMMMYIAGWRLIVGTVGEKQQDSRMVTAYLAVSILFFILAMIWFARLLLSGSI